MGLDNGIILRIKDNFNRNLPLDELENYNTNLYELCYWRKCWNVRGIILNIISLHKGIDVEDADEYSWNLSFEVLADIIEALKQEYQEDVWAEAYADGDTIWEADILEIYHRDLTQLEKWIELLKNEPADTFDIFFYDSY